MSFKYTYPENYWNTQLPVKGSDEPTFPLLGFEFGSFTEQDLWRDANLPEDWDILVENSSSYFLIDKNKCKRVAVYRHPAHMHLIHRFSVAVLEIDETTIEFVAWDNNIPYDENVLKIFSKSYSVPSKKQHPEIYKQRRQQYAEEKAAISWLNRNFPNWNDYAAYWGEVFDFDKLKDK